MKLANDDDKELAKAIGEQIRVIRKAKGISQEKLSEMVGISKNHMGCLERAEYLLNITTIHNISLALDVKPSEIFIKAGY